MFPLYEQAAVAASQRQPKKLYHSITNSNSEQVTSTGSPTGALALASTMILCIFLNVLNFTAATSRQIFAFARDDGFPFRHWIARVNRKTGSPQNALVVVILFVVLIALIVLGSTVAFQAVISLGTLALASTYELSILCLVWRRVRGAGLPAHA